MTTSSCRQELHIAKNQLKLVIYAAAGLGLGHESLSILFRYAHNLLSARDPGSLVRRGGPKPLLTSLRLSRPIFGPTEHRKAGKSLLFCAGCRTRART